jgi:hypothetical protein
MIIGTLGRGKPSEAEVEQVKIRVKLSIGNTTSIEETALSKFLQEKLKKSGNNRALEKKKEPSYEHVEYFQFYSDGLCTGTWEIVGWIKYKKAVKKDNAWQQFRLWLIYCLDKYEGPNAAAIKLFRDNITMKEEFKFTCEPNNDVLSKVNGQSHFWIAAAIAQGSIQPSIPREQVCLLVCLLANVCADVQILYPPRVEHQTHQHPSLPVWVYQDAHMFRPSSWQWLNFGCARTVSPM